MLVDVGAGRGDGVFVTGVTTRRVLSPAMDVCPSQAQRASSAVRHTNRGTRGSLTQAGARRPALAVLPHFALGAGCRRDRVRRRGRPGAATTWRSSCS